MLHIFFLAALLFTPQEEQLIEFVKTSIDRAEQGESKLTQEILNLEGMSSPKVRHFLNNLCTLPNTHYLEIGCWKGSTFISAQYQNQDTITEAIGIDDWSEFYGPKEAFESNVNHFLPLNSFQFFSDNCFKIDPSTFIHTPITIYFYDGNHSFQAQEEAFTHYNPALSDLFIAIVDDWNWQQVRDGTYSAFKKLNYEILYDRSLPSNGNGDRTNWWNGLYVAVIRRN